MNRVRLFTCLALVLVIVAFVAVWLTLPDGHDDVTVASLDYPAKLFRYGATDYLDCARSDDPSCDRTPNANVHMVRTQTMKNHALVFFGGLAAVVLLLGIAFSAFSRREVQRRQAW